MKKIKMKKIKMKAPDSSIFFFGGYWNSSSKLRSSSYLSFKHCLLFWDDLSSSTNNLISARGICNHFKG